MAAVKFEILQGHLVTLIMRLKEKVTNIRIIIGCIKIAVEFQHHHKLGLGTEANQQNSAVYRDIDKGRKVSEITYYIYHI
jgi:hypothetical protein